MQYEKILDVIAEDATGRGYFLDILGNYCAIGGLLKAASVEDARLMMNGATSAEDREVLWDAYGLYLRQHVTRDEVKRLNERFEAAGLTVPPYLRYQNVQKEIEGAGGILPGYDLEDVIVGINDWHPQEDFGLPEAQEVERRRVRLRELFLALKDVEEARQHSRGES